MKKIILAAAALVAGLTANAADATWNFSTFAAGNITENLSQAGLAIHVNDGSKNKFTIDNSSKGDYTQRLKSNGKSVLDTVSAGVYTCNDRFLSFKVAGASTITLHYLSSNSGDGVNRYICIGDAATGNELFSQNADDAAKRTTNPKVNEAVFNYTGGATILNIYFPVNAINLYSISATNVDDTYTAVAEAAAAEKVQVAQVGLVKIFNDGSKEIAK